MYPMVCRVCVAAILMSSASVGALAAGIGTVVDVVNEGYRTPPGASELLAKPTDELVQGEALRTGSESTIGVKFIDGSELSVEAESEILLSDYVFDTNGAAVTPALQRAACAVSPRPSSHAAPSASAAADTRSV